MSNFQRSRLKRKSRYSKSQKKHSKLKLAIYFLVIIGLFNVFNQNSKTNNESSQEIVINIEAGDSLSSIAQQLKDNKLIKSKFLFVRQAKKENLDTKLQPGIFRLTDSQDTSSILETLSTYIPQESKITIPEGYKISQIDDLLSSKGLIPPGDFTQCTQICDINHQILSYLPSQETRNLEGLLFPDTYFVDSQDFQSQELIIKMLDNFQNHLPSDINEKVKSLPKTDIYTSIIMASIIEREVLSQADKEIVSGLLWKRFSNGWPLGADATLLYLKDDNIISYQDLQDDNPYNTRKNLGFPPTPIANPGESSLIAALNPQDSDYWFYLTTLDTGEVIYSKTNEEHNQNKNKYL